MVNYYVVLILSCLGFHSIYSQNQELFYIPDSLKGQTYDELFDKYYEIEVPYNQESSPNFIKSQAYAKAYLNKAKNKKDTIKIANGYSQLASIVNDSLAIIYADSIMKVTQNIETNTYPCVSYFIKGIAHYDLGQYEEALNNLFIAHKYALKHNDIEYLFLINDYIGKIKELWGDEKDVNEIFKSQFKLIVQNKDSILDYQNEYFNTLLGLSNSYIYIQKLDSALIYAKRGIKESLEKKDTSWYYSFVSHTGIIAYYNNDFKTALDSINKAEPFEELDNHILNTHYYKGNIYNKQHNDDLAFYHFKKADSIYDATQDVVPEVRGVQAFFVDYYKKKKDINNQLKYIDKLLYVDSIIDSYRKNLNETIYKKYDKPNLLAEKQNIIATLQKGRRNSKLINVGLIFLVLTIIGFAATFYYRQYVYKQRLNAFLRNESKKEVIPETPKARAIEMPSVSKDVAMSILVQLKTFETNRQFLNTEITLENLSKIFNTNSNYLSKVINYHKQVNFSTYLSDLRIDYCIEKLKADKKFRSYTVKAIAQDVGFKNTESFSKAFYKKTEVYPSFFIKNFKKNKLYLEEAE